jgi:hypothetical protein
VAHKLRLVRLENADEIAAGKSLTAPIDDIPPFEMIGGYAAITNFDTRIVVVARVLCVLGCWWADATNCTLVLSHAVSLENPVQCDVIDDWTEPKESILTAVRTEYKRALQKANLTKGVT